MLKKLKIFSLTVPLMAFAADVDSFLGKLSSWIGTLLPIVVAIALLYFFFGLIKFITSGGDSEKKEEAKNTMVWGVIALFVMVSVWGLVSFIGTSLDIDQGGTGDVPGVDLTTSTTP
jgi:succinate dehydrogenase/fumarate reductase cytochrome b subunit